MALPRLVRPGECRGQWLVTQRLEMIIFQVDHHHISIARQIWHKNGPERMKFVCLFVHTGSKSKRQENEKREPESRRNKTGRTALFILFARIPQIFELWPFLKICRSYIGGLSTENTQLLTSPPIFYCKWKVNWFWILTVNVFKCLIWHVQL